jgi:D-alanyl-D-alanine carboxypeptidase/D-alanyl-D-alanine-endopeptidase (penicillin-binding protein 4)
MARTTAAAWLAKGVTRVRVDVDDSLFPVPTSALGWKRTYTIEDVSPVRALVVDHHRRWDTSLDAGNVFARKLQKWGLDVRRVARAARPATSTVVTESHGLDLATQIANMLKTSDNDVAEGLHRLVALQTGFPATWAGAQAAQASALTRLGVPLVIGLNDGSGLSRRDRLSPATLVAVLGKVFDGQHPNLLGLQQGSFAVAGVSGTLAPHYLRYVTNPTRCAAGLIQAKTGSLTGVISLTGFARGADGQVKLFSFLLNQVPSTLTTRRAVDRLAATVTGCW